MLRQLQIKNFKAWKNTGRIRLAPLTVFFGANSSGKTSLMQLLLMLKQTAESPDRQRVLHPGDRHTPVDLGTFQDMIFAHDAELPLWFRMDWSLEKDLKVQDSKSDRSYRSEEISFEATVRRLGAAAGQLAVQHLEYDLRGRAEDSIRVALRRAEEDSGKYQLEMKGYTPVRNQGRKWPLPHPVKFYGFPDEAVAYYQNTGFLSDLTLRLEQLFSRLHYLGPLRGYPERTYVWSGEVPEHVGWRGERAVEALLAAKGREISPGYGKHKKSFEEVVARWLQELGLIETFQVRPIAKGRKEYEVRAKTLKGSDEVNLTDVGFGVSQVLPVLVQCFYVPRGSILLLEQPEIHLHPLVQASLADLFIEAIQAREDGKARDIQLLVESHSEHFLRRLQRRVAEEALEPEDLAIYFCRPTPAGSVIEELKVDDFGNITNWPESFFGDEMGDLAAMTEAAMHRQSQGVAR